MLFFFHNADDVTDECGAYIYRHRETPFGLVDIPGSLPKACNYYLKRGTVKIRYLDFPASLSCADVHLTVYYGLTATILKSVCGGESHCDEIVVPINRTSRVRFFYNGHANSSFGGFAMSLLP